MASAASRLARASLLSTVALESPRKRDLFEGLRCLFLFEFLVWCSTPSDLMFRMALGLETIIELTCPFAFV